MNVNCEKEIKQVWNNMPAHEEHISDACELVED